jgi:pimeloyl-ACP methyl ester carboxylesterase
MNTSPAPSTIEAPESQPTTNDKTEKLAAGSHAVPLNGITLHFVVSGQGPLLFVMAPGWGIGSTYLRRGLTELEKTHTLVYIDPRGSGKSTRPFDPAHMSTMQMADDIDELRRYLGLDSITLLGHSHSGAIALAYAQRHQHHLDRLILVDSQLFGCNGADVTEQFLRGASNDFRYREAVSRMGAPAPTTDEAFSQMVKKMLPLYFHDPAKNLPLFELTMGDQLSLWAFRSQNLSDKLSPTDQTATLSELRIKTLILVGQFDWICPVVVSERLHDGLPNSELVILENSGHFPWIEEPARFFSSIRRFLNN